MFYSDTMSGGGVFLSPPGSGSRVPATPQEQYLSPSTRRNLPLTTPQTTSSSLPLADQNDDEAERKERRRSRVLELQRRNISSPATPPSDR